MPHLTRRAIEAGRRNAETYRLERLKRIVLGKCPRLILSPAGGVMWCECLNRMHHGRASNDPQLVARMEAGLCWARRPINWRSRASSPELQASTVPPERPICVRHFGHGGQHRYELPRESMMANPFEPLAAAVPPVVSVQDLDETIPAEVVRRRIIGRGCPEWHIDTDGLAWFCTREDHPPAESSGWSDRPAAGWTTLHVDARGDRWNPSDPIQRQRTEDQIARVRGGLCPALLAGGWCDRPIHHAGAHWTVRPNSRRARRRWRS